MKTNMKSYFEFRKAQVPVNLDTKSRMLERDVNSLTTAKDNFNFVNNQLMLKILLTYTILHLSLIYFVLGFNLCSLLSDQEQPLVLFLELCLECMVLIRSHAARRWGSDGFVIRQKTSSFSG